MDYARDVPIECHNASFVFSKLPVVWQRHGEGDKYKAGEDPFRCCSYCGSIHPLDLLRYMERGQADVSGSDWKYGWPHKFYVDVPNPHEGVLVQVGSRWHNGEEEVIMGKAPHFLHAKFYALHLNDLNAEEFEAVAALLLVYSGILYERRGGKLWYSAPRAGHQALGQQNTLFRRYVREEGMEVGAALARAAKEMREQMQQGA